MKTNPSRYFVFNVPLTHHIDVSNKVVSEVLCRQLTGYDEEYLLYKMNPEPSNNLIFDISNKLIEKTVVGFSYLDEHSVSSLYSENENKEIILNLSLGDKNKMLLLLRKSILGDILQLETNCIHCNEKISQDLSISEVIEYSNHLKPNFYLDCTNIHGSNDVNTDTDADDNCFYWTTDDYIDSTDIVTNNFKDHRKIKNDNIKISPLTVGDHYKLIEVDISGVQTSFMSQKNDQPQNPVDSNNSVSFNQPYQKSEIEDYYKNLIISHLVRADSEESLKKILSKEGILEQINDKLLEIDPLSYIDLNFVCPYCQRAMSENFYTEHFILQELYLYCKQLPVEVNWIALNYNWTEEDILSLPISKRKHYVELISKSLSGELFL
ncbi:MAG: hypothetical protein AB7V56_11520 [Candidatus Nitrosocosmicus sp.]